MRSTHNHAAPTHTMSDDESSIGESTGNNTRYIKPVVSPLNIPPTVHTSFTSDSATPTPHTSNGPPPASPQASRGPPPPSPAASRSPSSYFSFAFPRRNNSSRTVHKSNDVEMGEVGEKTKNMEKTDNPENTEDTENTHKKKVVRVDFKGTNEKSKTPRMHVMSNDDFKLHNRFRLYMLVIWIVAISVSIWYTVQVDEQYRTSLANPSSTVIIEKEDRLPLPQVTVCNWNQNGDQEDPVPVEGCDECELELVSCVYNTTIDCHGLWSKRQYLTSAGIFSCYDFNSFPFDVLYSSTTAYTGSYATIWSYLLPERSNPPTNRAGVQVSFYASGQVDPKRIYDEVRFAPVGHDAFYALQLVTTIHSELPFYDQMYNQTAFTTPVTTTNLLSRGTTKKGNATMGYTGISFSYQTLSKQTVYFGISYTLEALFGDLAGVLGSLMGIDVIKLSVGLGLAFICWKHKNIDLLADLFNG